MSTYSVAYSDTRVVVLDMPLDELRKLPSAKQDAHIVAELKISGTMTRKVADIFAEKIAEQLNQFEIANAAVAKMF